MLLLRDVVAAIGIELEMHGTHRELRVENPAMWDCIAGFAASGGLAVLQP